VSRASASLSRVCRERACGKAISAVRTARTRRCLNTSTKHRGIEGRSVRRSLSSVCFGLRTAGSARGGARRKGLVGAMNVLDFQKMKDEGRRISMVTCYDYSSARAVAESNIDCILVGDSVAMTVHGHPNTLAATTSLMALHTSAVARGAPSKFIVADLPFLSYRKGLQRAMDSVQTLMKAGAHALKLEAVRGHADIIRHIVESGVPVMGHLGLTPQSVNLLGGMKVQARTDASVDRLISQAAELEQAGCFA